MLGYRRNNNTTSITNTQITQIINSFDVNGVGQTFYEIITQQPYKFTKNDISLNSSFIILRWNYNSIIAKHDNNSIAKLANLFDYTQYLPFINNIFIDISGVVDIYNNTNYNIYNNTWITLDIITISGDYNVSDFKQYILQRSGYMNSTDFSHILINNIIVNNMPFSIRVYGENYSNDYPTVETRALVFNNLYFVEANIPSTPQFIDSNASNANNIILTYYNEFSEISNPSSSAYLTNYSVDYSLNDILISSSQIKTNNGTINGIFASNINSNSNFTITLTNLLSGASYYHRVKVHNNFLNTYSDYSTISDSKYTLLPNDNNIGTSINITIAAQCYKYVSNSSNLSNSSILYFNIANTSHSFRFTNSSIQQFQITHPYSNIQQLQDNRYGYGKFIDNSFNLVTINLSINGVAKHTINYGGFNTNPSYPNPYIYSKSDYTTNGNDFILNNINNNNIEDIYSDISNIGYRLKGYLLLKSEIESSNIVNYFGVPSSNPYIMNFNYIRNISVGASDSINNTYEIYIDELTGNPVISNTSNAILIQDVVYNMGVPSVKYFKLVLTRTYSNINSINKYIVGNRIVADFYNNSYVITSFARADIQLQQSDICDNGIYNYNLSYDNIAYFQRVKNNISFNLLEKVYNFNGFTSSNISLISKPFCDYNSFNKSNSIISFSKLNLNTLHIYEISNIELLGSNLSNIELKHYNSHTNNILPNTLLYLDSSFNNIFSSYPNSSDFSYNNLDISYNTYGNISYDLSGMSTNNQGYKWIVFKIFKNTDNTDTSYLFNDISYPIQLTSDGNAIRYLPLKQMLKDSGLFLDSIVDDIFNITNNNALMFGHATLKLRNFKKYFNIKQNFNPGGGIWTENSYSNNISYNTTVNNINFGSNISSNSIYCPITSLNNDLTIYIGLKEKL
jgi:hypothetical protein